MRDFNGTAMGLANVRPGGDRDGDGDSERSLDVSLESEANMLPISILLATRSDRDGRDDVVNLDWL